MGLFSTKKTISVASSLINLSGDDADRQNYLKSNLFSAIISGNHKSYLGETIVGNYLRGPGIQQRRFFRWATNRDFFGVPTFSSRNQLPVDPEIVKPFIDVPVSPVGLVTEITNSFISDGDFTYYAQQYILENNPSLIATDWIAEYDESTHQIIIEYDGGGSDTFAAGGYSADNRDIIAYHFHQVPSSSGSVVNGTLFEDIDDIADLGSDIGYSVQSISNTDSDSFMMNVKTTVLTEYSDGRSDTTDITNNPFTDGHNNTLTIKTKTEYTGDPPTGSTEFTYNLWERREISVNITESTEVIVVGGVTQTITTTVETDYLSPIYDYRVDTQDFTFSDVQQDRIFIYTIGTGELVLDALDTSDSSGPIPEFFPFIPLRLGNDSIREEPYLSNGIFDDCEEAYKEVTNGLKIGEILDSLEENEDIDDVDYAYIEFGVPLNTRSNSGKKYIYAFLKNMIPYQNTTPTYMNNFIAGLSGFTGEPDITTIRVVTDDPTTQAYDVRLSWVNIQEEFLIGEVKTNPAVGDVEIEALSSLDWSGNSMKVMRVNKQITANTFSRLTVYGFVHRNYIYGGKHVYTDTEDAINHDDPDYEDSSFLIPLHYPTLKSISIRDSTQVSTECMFLVLNSYVVTKQKWYQTGIFAVILFVAIIIISVLINPALLAAAPGILGTNLVVGTALGLTGIAAIVAGAIVNAIVAMVVARVLAGVATDIFGEQLGTIIAAVVTILISGNFDVSSFANIGTMSVDNILSLSNVLANTYIGRINGDIADIYAELKERQSAYDETMGQINELLKGLGNNLNFNPMQLTDISKGNGLGSSGYLPENLDQFIQRTTLVGSDIVEITLSMVTDFPEISLQLPKN